MTKLITILATIAISIAVIASGAAVQPTKQAACLAQGGTLHYRFIAHKIGDGRSWVEGEQTFTCLRK